MAILLENMQLALEALRSNKMRALLTMLGIIIGIGSVIAIVTVGDSLSSSVSSEMQSLGASNVYILLSERESEFESPMSVSMVETDLITDDMLEQYKEIHGDSIAAVSVDASGGSGKVADGRLYANVSITGVNDGYADVNSVEMISGRFIRESDVKARRSTAVVSDKLVSNMFDDGVDPLGKEIKVTVDGELQTYTIVGVYEYQQSMMTGFSTASDKDVRTSMYIPITTCNLLTGTDDGYSYIIAMAAVGVDSTEFASDAERFFNIYYENNTNYEVTTMNMETMIDTISTMMSTIELAVTVIAGISLIVGGIGVMNIMLVSVTERTREIGTRKALGARNSSIRIQFIVESIIICTIGGVIGVILGMLLGYGGSALLGFPGLPSLIVIVIAVAFSMAIGIFFGYYPANKAAQLDPIEALRYE